MLPEGCCGDKDPSSSGTAASLGAFLFQRYSGISEIWIEICFADGRAG